MRLGRGRRLIFEWRRRSVLWREGLEIGVEKALECNIVRWSEM